MATQFAADTPQQWQPSVFVGSSSEALSVVDELAKHLQPYFRVHPWKETIAVGQYTMLGLLEEVSQVDAAIFVFAKDDKMEFRGDATYSARGNVLLEYGLFVASLGRDRVMILEEEGVNLPSDVLGIATKKYPANAEFHRDTLNRFVEKEVLLKWGKIPPRAPAEADVDDAGLGYADTLQQEFGSLREVRETLSQYSRDPNIRSQEPIVLGAQSAPISAYKEALARVQRRFWTTTFLSSGFWTRPQGDVLAANEQMLERIKHAGGQAHRLFLLDQHPDSVAQAYRDHRILQRQLQKNQELKLLEKQHYYLKSNMNKLLKQGFEVKVIYDETLRYNDLPDDLLPDPADSELAIYDDFRLDVFQGGKHGLVHSVISRSPAYQYFQIYLDSAASYFEDLWQRAMPMERFIANLQAAVDSATAKIDYESNWLAIYEYALPKEEEDLKTVEMGRVTEVLGREMSERSFSVRSYLDIGTCTGRYPIRLREYVEPDGRVLGIDEDYDCVRFAQARIQQECPDDNRIEVRRVDFTGPESQLQGPFDLITCMLGTLSHFGWDRASDYNDMLQRSLIRMAALLANDGLMFLGTWSDYARERRDMLGIYRTEDLRRLSEWTPSGAELIDRLQHAGLEVVEQVNLPNKLDLTWCRHVLPHNPADDIGPAE
jgi:SAM-dependent methyltransferase